VAARSIYYTRFCRKWQKRPPKSVSFLGPSKALAESEAQVDEAAAELWGITDRGACSTFRQVKLHVTKGLEQ